MCGLKRMKHYTGIFHSVEFAARTSGKPLRIEIASLTRPQFNERRIDFGFQIIWRTIASRSERRLSLRTQPRLGAIHPKNNRSLSGISLVLLIAEPLHHGILAVAVHYRQPARSRVQP